MTSMKRIGSVHAVVVSARTAKIMITATTRIVCISLAVVSIRDLFWIAIPEKHPLSPVISFSSVIAFFVRLESDSSSNVISMTAQLSL